MEIKIKREKFEEIIKKIRKIKMKIRKNFAIW